MHDELQRLSALRFRFALVRQHLLESINRVDNVVAVVAIALSTLRRRPLGNGFILTGVAVAATGSALAGLGAAQTAVFIAVAALLLYAGFVFSSGERPGINPLRRTAARTARRAASRPSAR